MRQVAEVVVQNTNAEIDGALRGASVMGQQGESAKSAEIYKQLISLRPGDDDRRTDAENCLVSAKAGVKSSKSNDC